MKYAFGSRRDLLQWTSGRSEMISRAANSAKTIGEWLVPSGELLFAWPDDEPPLPLPHLTVCVDINEREFLAWAATYLPLRPITAFTRVVTLSEINSIRHSQSPATSSVVSLGLVGAVIAEMLIRNGEGSALRVLPSLSVAMETYSFVAARAVATGMFDAFADLMRDRWFTLQRATRGVRVTTAAIFNFWQRLAHILSPRADRLLPLSPELALASTVSELLRNGDLSSQSWHYLTGLEYVEFRERTVEERVRRFQQQAVRVRERNLTAEARALAVAYMANQILPGSFEHTELLHEVAPELESAVLWYGFIAGATPSSRLALLMNGFGWRLHREITASESMWQRTRADIAVTEMAILDEVAATRATIRPSMPPYLTVEVLPTVYCHVSGTFRSDNEQMLGIARGTVNELGAALSRALELYRELTTTVEGKGPKSRTERKRR